MDLQIRNIQQEVLNICKNVKGNFALSGGTALELYYLHHRFSADLDFFSPDYDITEINIMIARLTKYFKKKIKLEAEFTANGRARVKFYSLPIKNYKKALKIDFVEDVIFKKPTIRKFNGVSVYDVQNIYLQKLLAITGTSLAIDELGREMTTGRKQARDTFDIYMLSKKIEPLHIFLQRQARQIQRGMVHWYRTFSRQDLRFDILDLDIYEKKFDSKEMIIYLEGELKELVQRELR